MPRSLLADAVLLVHVAFVLFVVFGGLLVLRRRWWAWLHLPAAIWGVVVEWGGFVCPLTPLEHSLRTGDPAAGPTFVERFVVPWLYPAGLTPELQLVLGGLVVLVNVVVYSVAWRKWRRRAEGEGEV